jgi:DeoR/GlpR family transcriptional regulator of sugar metabolism
MPPIVQKQNDNTKYNRINQIYEMLKNNVHGMTITELAKELDVSTKTIQRDLYEVLSDFGAIKEGRTWKIDPKLTQDNLNSNEKLILGILDEMAKECWWIYFTQKLTLYYLTSNSTT